VASETLQFNLLARDNASRVFDKVGAAASGTESRFSKVGRGLLAVGKMAGRGAVAFGALGAAGAVMGLKTAASMEQARISFTTMLGSAKKADTFLKQLAAFAAKTPFEFPELQTAASSLISAGFHAKEVIPIMTTLGDVTSGMGTGAEGVQRATVALQQMSAAGKITGEDLNQLRDAGVPVFDLLSAATGKSKAAISELAAAGKLGKTEMQALFDALGSGKGLERFNGLMEKQSQSLTGMWSTFKDTLGMGLAKAIEPAIPAIKAGLEKLTGFIAAALEALPGIVGKVKDFAGPIVQKIRDALPQIVTAVGEWRTAIAGFLTGVVVKVEPFITAVRTALDTGNWGPVGESLGNALAAAIRGAGAAVGKIGEAFSSLMGRIDFVGMGIAIGRQAPALIIGFAAGLLNFDLGGLLAGLWAHWQDILLAGIAIWLAPVKIIGKVGQMLAKIPLIGRFLEWALVGLKGFVDNVAGAIGRAISGMGNAFMAGFRRVFPGIGESFAQGLALLPLRLAVLAIDIAQAAGRMMMRLRGAILDRIGNVIAALGQLVANMIKPFTNIAGLLTSYGRAAVMGFINGIKSMAGAAASAAMDVVKGAVNSAKNFLKIGSPSRVMMEIGQFFTEGFAIGTKQGAAKALEAVTELMEKVKTKLADLRTKAAQIRSTAHDAVMGALNVGSLGETTTSTDAAGNEVTTTANPTAQIAAFTAQAAAFSAAISAAVARGVNSKLIAQVAALGPEQGLVAAQALAAMNAAQVNQVNRDLAVAEKFASKVGATVLSTTPLPAQIRREEATLNAVRDLLGALRNHKTVVELDIDGKAFARAVARDIRQELDDMARRRGE
jgi:tape measure domain-containing protein